jgi:RNA polymerase sigma factor (sigma-70 family)
MRTSTAPVSMTDNNDLAIVRERLGELLVAVGRSRDRQAFKTVFEYFAPRLKSYFLRQGTEPGVAEEVVQETMVNIWRRAEQFRPEKASASTWVFAIARNMRIDLLRKSRHPETDIGDPALVADPQPLADELTSIVKDGERLRTTIAGLPPEQQVVLRMAFFEDKSHAQVAEELGVPLGTVKSRIRLAVRRVRSEFGEVE